MFLLAALTACATQSPPPIAKTEAPHTAVHWFHGSVEEAFAAAKAQGKPMFLYWGAVWCPPCNQIKSVVLSSPEVGEVLDATVPVYLDGDTANAQTWADKLHVSGYPTLLMLDPNGKELLRIGEIVEAPELIAAVRGVLASGETLPETIRRALAPNPPAHVWTILAYADWDQSDAADLKTRLQLFDRAPPSEAAARSLLAAWLLESVATAPAPEDVTKAIRDQADTLIEAMLASKGAIWASRSILVSFSKEIVGWLFPNPADPRRADAEEKWLKAARWIRRQPNSSLSTRLLSAAPRAELWLLDHPSKPLPFELLAEVRLAVVDASRAAVTRYERHAVISDAADLLDDAGDIAGARVLLEKELRRTDTPWYYQAELARLALKGKDYPAALDWSAKARLSARGNATRLQWTVSDLLLNAEVPGADQPVRIARLLDAYYQVAFALPDGFSGRNGARARKVAGKLSDWNWPEVAAVVSRYRARCSNDSCAVAFAVR